MPSPEISINGIQLTATADVVWELRNGVAPVVKVFEGPRDELAKLRDEGGPVTLTIVADPANELVVGVGGIGVGRRETTEIQNLYIIGETPGPDPFVSGIVVADRRWWWQYPQIKGTFNLRRNVGFNRITAIDVVELQPVEPDVWYAPFSTKDGEGEERWDPIDLLKEVIDRAFRGERELRADNFPAPIVEDPEGIALNDGVSIESLDLAGRADREVDRVLHYLPDISFYIDLVGNVVLHQRGNGADADLLNIMGPEKTAGGHVELIDLRRQIPRSVDVLFTREIEVKFRFREADDEPTATRPAIDNRRFVDNVLPNPVPDNAGIGAIVVNGETITQGTYLRIGEFLLALPVVPGLNTKLTREFLRRAGVPFMDLWPALELLGVETPDFDFAVVIAALQRHHLRTYQINRRWMDRTLSLRAYRVGTVNPETGQRAPAEVYADHAIITGLKWLWKNLNDDVTLEYAVNVDGFPDGGLLGPTARPAPAEVQILDHDQGVWTTNFLVDPMRQAQQLLPTKLSSTNIPTGNMRDRTRSISYNSIVAEGAELPKLQADHEALLLLTLVPGAPNTVDQLQRVRITPDDIRDLVTPQVFQSISGATGPRMERIIGEAIETARVRWLDDRAADIERAFGFIGFDDEGEDEQQNPLDDGTDQPPGGLNDVSDQLADLIVNLNTNNLPDGQKAASINEIARAVAARVYSRMVTRPQGSMTGNFQPRAVPVGWVESVAHTIDPTGELSTDVTFPDDLPELDMLALLPADVRAIILREAVRRKAT